MPSAQLVTVWAGPFFRPLEDTQILSMLGGTLGGGFWYRFPAPPNATLEAN